MVIRFDPFATPRTNSSCSIDAEHVEARYRQRSADAYDSGCRTGQGSQGRDHDDSEETKVAAKVTMGSPAAA